MTKRRDGAPLDYVQPRDERGRYSFKDPRYLLIEDDRGQKLGTFGIVSSVAAGIGLAAYLTHLLGWW